MKKKILSLVLISLITALSFFGQLTSIYADVTPPNTSMSEQDMTDAFLAYAASRNVHIEGSLLAGVTTFTTQTYNSICRRLGINPTTLQAELHKVFDLENNRLLYYSFSALGINQFNRIFAQFLLDNDLSVGDENIDKLVYSGKLFTDSDNNSCLVYYVNLSSTQLISNATFYDIGSAGNIITKYGTTYIYGGDDFLTLYNVYGQSNRITTPAGHSFYVKTNYNDQIQGNYRNLRDILIYADSSKPNVLTIQHYMFGSDQYLVKDGYNGSTQLNNYGTDYSGSLIMAYCNDNRLVYGTYTKKHVWSDNSNSPSVTDTDCISGIGRYNVEPVTEPVDINITTPDDKQVLPAPPNDEPINISPDGNTDQDPDDPDDPTPVIPPGGTKPDWTIPDGNLTPDGDGGFNIDWDFQLPDLDIDWSINGLKDKFPFCIPFDFINLINVLNVEPEAPRIQGTINLLVYQWNVDFDFSQFDNIASIARNLIFIGFCLGLILITRRLIKG